MLPADRASSAPQLELAVGVTLGDATRLFAVNGVPSYGGGNACQEAPYEGTRRSPRSYAVTLEAGLESDSNVRESSPGAD